MTIRLAVCFLAIAAQTSAAGPDLSLPRPDDVDVIGTTSSQALLKLSGGRRPYYGVLDLGTRCIVETRPAFALVDGLRGNTQIARALADRATQDEIRQYIELRSRFGMRKDAESIYAGDFAWSADLSKIVTTQDGAFYRSRDGGRNYELLDTNKAYKPYVTGDGRFAFYQRCGAPKRTHACSDAEKEVGIVDLERASKPRIVSIGRGMIEGLDPTGQRLLVVRDDEPGKVVATHLDPSGQFHRAFSIPAPRLEPDTFFTITPSRHGRYGEFHHWISPRGSGGLRQAVAVVDMSTGKIVHRQQQPFVGSEVDDDGRLAWGTVNSVRAYATSPRGKVRDAGPGDRVGWAPGGRLITFQPPTKAGTLGDAVCRVVGIKTIAD